MNFLFVISGFCPFSSIMSMHFYFIPDLLARLERLRGSEKTVGEVGPTLLNWVSVFHSADIAARARQRHSEHFLISLSYTSPLQFPCLEAYVTYCCNQVGAKALLDHKKQQKRVEHFLRLCQESSFSRKLDLWNFLDLPRSRLVKYPLLLKEIQKCTPPDHPDEDSLPDAVSCFAPSVFIWTDRLMC